MKKITCLVICLSMIFQFCIAQSTPNKEYYSKDFNWRITIPENFIALDSAEWKRMESKGAAIVNKANNKKVENHSTTIFSFKTDQMNYFECSYQPFDPAADGDYLKTKQAVNDMLYKTLITQLQGVKVDTTMIVEKISNLEFHTFITTVTYPNKMILHMLLYYRLFDKKEFAMNIFYKDEEKGQQMLSAWKSSTFAK